MKRIISRLEIKNIFVLKELGWGFEKNWSSMKLIKYYMDGIDEIIISDIVDLCMGEIAY